VRIVSLFDGIPVGGKDICLLDSLTVHLIDAFSKVVLRLVKHRSFLPLVHDFVVYIFGDHFVHEKILSFLIIFQNIVIVDIWGCAQMQLIPIQLNISIHRPL